MEAASLDAASLEAVSLEDISCDEPSFESYLKGGTTYVTEGKGEDKGKEITLKLERWLAAAQSTGRTGDTVLGRSTA